MDRIYLVINGNVNVNVNTPVALRDIAQAYSKTVDVVRVLDRKIYPGSSVETITTISAFDVMETVYAVYPQADVEILGNEVDVLVTVEGSRVASKGALKFTINVLIYALLFLGSAMSVMYFHMDVGMLDAMKEFIRILGGEGRGSLVTISVAYSVGLLAGMLFFFKKKKIAKKKIPSPIDLKMENYNTGITTYLKNRLGKGK
jgi:stage V sporulation protein AA